MDRKKKQGKRVLHINECMEELMNGPVIDKNSGEANIMALYRRYKKWLLQKLQKMQ